MYSRSLLVLLVACAPGTQHGGGNTGIGPDSAVSAQPTITTPAAIAPGGVTPPDIDPCAGLEGCVDVDSLPVRWRTGPGTGMIRVVDPQGPGTHGLAVWPPGGADTFVLSKPPFAVDRSDFADATATYGTYPEAAGDLTGDGITDFVRYAQWAEGEKEVIAGPLVGDADAMPILRVLAPEDGIATEVTGDAVLDRLVNPEPAKAGAVVWTEVHPGPLAGWDAPASMRFEVEYAADATYDCIAMNMPLNLYPRDLDGDGNAELQLGSAGLGEENPCPFHEMYGVPSDFVGTVRRTEDEPFPFARYSTGELVPDQDGDGVPDTVFYGTDPLTGELARGLYSGPMAEKDGWWVPAGPRLLTMPDVTLNPLWDIDGDGIVEWFADVSFAPETVPATVATRRWAVYRGGVESLAGLQALGYWGTRHAYPVSYFILPEEKALFVPTADGFAIVDLSALEP